MGEGLLRSKSSQQEPLTRHSLRKVRAALSPQERGEGTNTEIVISLEARRPIAFGFSRPRTQFTARQSTRGIGAATCRIGMMPPGVAHAVSDPDEAEKITASKG
jgi:hypothetical protein